MPASLSDRIYEAAFVPEGWPPLLEAIGEAAGSASGALQILKPGHEPLWTATDLIRDTLGDFIARGLWRVCERPAGLAVTDHAGFLHSEDCLTAEQLARDPVVPLLDKLGLGGQAATLIAMPSGEMVGLTFERLRDRGRHEARGLALLDGLRPHLARAALICARLGLERARAATAALDALGLAAAVLTRSGTVLASNERLDAAPAFKPAAFGRLMLAHPPADQLLREALSRPSAGAISHSIPIPGSEAAPAAILHVLPLRGSATDILGGAVLVALTTLGLAGGVPDLALLRGLFDLTPQEARLSASLASGRSLKEAARAARIQPSTARSYLEQILRKTGTSQQSQLVALIKGGGPTPSP